ncbi:MAG TPA: hypothetical protein VKU02_25830 [Gemmataceae bacterium]|nr:hypothetical protein [Gemmataceae bacterium]
MTHAAHLARHVCPSKAADAFIWRSGLSGTIALTSDTLTIPNGLAIGDGKAPLFGNGISNDGTIDRRRAACLEQFLRAWRDRPRSRASWQSPIFREQAEAVDQSFAGLG